MLASARDDTFVIYTRKSQPPIDLPLMKGVSATAAAFCALLMLITYQRRTESLEIGPSTPDSLASPAGPGAAEPNLAVAPDGRVYLSWLEPMSGGFALKISAFEGSRWSDARTVRTGRDFFVNWADFPSVNALGRGRLAAHWLQRTGGATYAYGVRVALRSEERRVGKECRARGWRDN